MVKKSLQVELNDRLSEVVYEGVYEYKLWNGYRLTAIGGSVMELPNTE